MKQFICIFGLVALAMAGDDKSYDVDSVFASATSRFTANFFSEVTKKNPGKSIVMSAYSLMAPLSQLALASEGESHDELLRAVGFPNDNVTKEVFINENRKLKTIKGIELRMANRVFIPIENELNKQFEEISRNVFGSEVKNIDFSKNVEAAHEINSWVENQTNSRIKDLVSADSLDANTRSVLVNAIYFKGTWEDQFEKNKTEDRDFHVSKDKVVKIPTMYRRGDFRYGESDELDAKLLEIFYEGREASLLIILPNTIDGLAALEEKLKDYEKYVPKAQADMHNNEVDVYLPKFKIETEINLKDILQKIDIKKLFSPTEAKLNYLLNGQSDLYVSDAIQKAFIEVNEEGAEAAAANAFGIAYLSAFVPRTLLFKADHPFVFYLNERNNPMFMGTFQD